jgi:site-specific DNA recombinase
MNPPKCETKKRRAIAVIRVSTDQQDCERQRRDVAAAARAHGLEIARSLELPGLSGTKMLSNAEVKRVLADLTRPDVGGVVVSAVDRLVRPGQLGDLAIFDAFQRTKKLIWTPGQEIDLSTNTGFLTSGIMGVIAGFERQLILSRTTAGKETVRLRGGHPDGGVALPRGIAYSKKTGWSYTEPDASLVRRAYDLLFERRSWHDIAAQLGHGWTYSGVSNTLRNPIWKGIRRYIKGRETPLEVPIDLKPLISPERWEAAQQIILEKRSNWRKTKRPPRFLLTGLLRCACGKPYYFRNCGTSQGDRSTYYCSTQFRGRGPFCGARSVRTVAADRLVERIVSTELLDAQFLKNLLRGYESGIPKLASTRDRFLKERSKLEGERTRLLRMTLKGTCTEEDFARESKRIESELRALAQLAPAAVPDSFDPAKLIVRITRAYRRFASQPLAERRSLLQASIREIVIDNRRIPSITLNGEYFSDALQSANLSPLSGKRRSRR